MPKIITKPFYVKTHVEVTAQRVADMLVGAFEGGSTYWIDKIEVAVAAEGFGTGKVDASNYYPRIIRTPLSGGVLRVYAVDAEGPKDLGLPEIQRGLETMALRYPNHWTDLIKETDDGTTADVFLQCCLFSEVLYG